MKYFESVGSNLHSKIWTGAPAWWEVIQLIQGHCLEFQFFGSKTYAVAKILNIKHKYLNVDAVGAASPTPFSEEWIYIQFYR